MRVAIPCMGETVAPCFEYCCTMAIYTADEGRILEQMDFPIRSREPLDRVRLLRDQQVDTLICGGMQDVFEKMLRGSGFEVISWVSGSVEDLLDMYLRGRLVSGTELPERDGAEVSGRRMPDRAPEKHRGLPRTTEDH